MEFFRNWPFQHYLTLRLLQQNNLGTFYYHISEDRLLTLQESENYSKPPYRRVDKYLIVGSRTLINQIFIDVPKNIIPTVPTEIQNLISQHLNQDDFIRSLLEKSKITEQPKITEPVKVIEQPKVTEPVKVIEQPKVTEPVKVIEQPKVVEQPKMGPTTPKLREEEFKPPFTTKITDLAARIKAAVESGKCVKLDTGTLVKKDQPTYIYNQNNDIPLCVVKKTQNTSKIFNYYEEKISEQLGGRKSSGKTNIKTSEPEKISQVEQLITQRKSVSPTRTQISPVRYKQQSQSKEGQGPMYFGVPTKFQRSEIPNIPLNPTILNTESIRKRLPGNKSPSKSEDVLSTITNEQKISNRKLEMITESPSSEVKPKPKNVNTNRRPQDVDIQFQPDNREFTDTILSKTRSRSPIVNPSLEQSENYYTGNDQYSQELERLEGYDDNIEENIEDETDYE